MKILKASIYASCAVAMLALVGCDRGRDCRQNRTASITVSGKGGVTLLGSINASSNGTVTITPTGGTAQVLDLLPGFTNGEFIPGNSAGIGAADCSFPIGDYSGATVSLAHGPLAGALGAAASVTIGGTGLVETDGVFTKAQPWPASIKYQWVISNATMQSTTTSGSLLVPTFTINGYTDASGNLTDPTTYTAKIPSIGETLENASVVMDFTAPHPALGKSATMTINFNNGSSLSKTVNIPAIGSGTQSVTINKLTNANNVVLNSIQAVTISINQ
jgi:hypothetical protein